MEKQSRQTIVVDSLTRNWLPTGDGDWNKYEEDVCPKLSMFDHWVMYSFIISHQLIFFTALCPFWIHHRLTHILINMPVDLLNPTAEQEARTHKLKRLVQSPNSFFMDIKCPGCFQITTVFSHAQTVVVCGSCNVMLCQPTGGRARLTEGCSFRKKVE